MTFATALGSGATVGANNTVVLGRSVDRVLTPGGIALSNNDLRLRTRDDDSHSISYNANINGMQFKAFDDFLWSNVRNNRSNMQLFSSGNLTIAGSLSQSSDARHKTDVQTFGNALDAVRRFRGVTFNWKPELNKGSDTQIGFIAQEVEAVLPALVSTDKEGYKSVAYANAVPVLVEAVKEQQKQIDEQQKQIAEQRLLIESLRKAVCSQNSQAEVCKR